MKNAPRREAAARFSRSGAGLVRLVSGLFAAVLLSSPAYGQIPSTCVISGTVLNGGSQPIQGANVRIRTVSPTTSGNYGITTNDLTTITDASGNWSLTVVAGLKAQVDIPAVGIANDIVVPSVGSCPVAFGSLTLFSRGTQTPATIISLAGPSMGGDLTGQSPNPSVIALRGQALQAGNCTNGQARVYSSGSNAYTCQAVTTGTSVTSITGGQSITVSGTPTVPVVGVTAASITNTQLGVGAAAANVGTVGGALSGTLPNPSLAAGVAATNLGAAGGDLSGTYPSPTVATVAASTAANVHAAELLANAATSANTPSTIVRRDGGGNFTAGTVTGNLTGTATNATNITGSLTGDASNVVNAITVKGLQGRAVSNAVPTNGQALTWVTGNNDWEPVSAVGTVTSVGCAGGGTGLSFSGCPITSSGTFTLQGTLGIGFGGTGATTANGGFNALSPLVALGDLIYEDATPKAVRLVGNTTTTSMFLNQVGNGSISAAPTWKAIAAADLPGTINSNTTGSAATLSGTVAIANGGTGQTTAVAGFGALSPTTTLGDIIYANGASTNTRLAGNTSATKNFLTSTGSAGLATAPAWGTIAAGDLPASISANTSGTAAGLSATLVVASGGTGAATFSTGILHAAGTSAFTSSAVGLASADVSGTLPIGNGGTGQTTATNAYNALSPTTTLGDLAYANGAGTNTRLAGSTSATKNFLTQTGNGSISAAPAWGTLVAADIPNLDTSKITTGTFAVGFLPNAAGDVTGALNANTVTKIQGNAVLAGTPTNGQVYQWVTANSRFEATTPASSAVSGVSGSGGTTGLTLTGGPTGNVTLTLGGTLGVPNGGTGATTASAGFNALSPVTLLGDLIYGSGASANSRLAGNTTSTKQFLTSTGSAGLATAPSWGALASGDIPNNAANTSGTASNVTGTVLVANGGTGAATFSAGILHSPGGTTALTSSAVSLTADVSGLLPIANGGTNASTAPNAIANLGALAKDGSVALTADWTTPKNVYSKNSLRIFNVLDAAYGADPTFGSDSTTAINNAITDAIAVASGGFGATVYIPKGHYKITSSNGIDLTNASGVELLGDGPTSTILDGNGTNPFVIYSNPVSSGALHDIRLRGLRVVNNGGAATTAAQIYNVLWFTIENCFFQNVVGTGGALNMSGVGNGVLIDVQAYGDNGPAFTCAQNAIGSQSCGPLEIHGGEFANQAGVQVSQVPAVKIVGNPNGMHFVGTQFQASGGVHVATVSLEGDSGNPTINVGTVTFEECHGESNYNAGSTAATFVIGQTTKFGSVRFVGGNYWGHGNSTLFDNYAIRVYAARAVIVEGTAFGKFATHGFDGGLFRFESGWPAAGDSYMFKGFPTYNLAGPIYSDGNATPLLSTSYTGDALGGTHVFNSGNVGVGTSGPDAPVTASANIAAPRAPTTGTLLHLVGTDATTARIGIDGFSSPGVLEFRQSAGTNTTPSATTTGQTIGNVSGKGYGATGYPATVRVQTLYQSDEAGNWSDVAQGTRITWGVTPVGTTTLGEQMRLSNDGSLWLNGGSASTQVARVGGALFTQTANKVTTANTLTSLFGTGVGSLTLPANYLIAGRTIRIRAGGFVSAADGGVSTKTLTVLLGGVTMATATSGATFQTVLNNGWEADATITARTVGAGGTCIGTGKWETQIATANLNALIATSTATAACNTTGTLAVDFQFNNGNATGTITTTWATVEVVN